MIEVRRGARLLWLARLSLAAALIIVTASALAAQEPERAPEPVAPAEPLAAPEVAVAPEVSAANSERAQELERELEALAVEREALAESLRALDERVKDAARARAEEIREQTQRLRETRREIQQSERELRETEQTVERERGGELDRNDDGWVKRARQRNPNEKFGFGSTVKVRVREVVGDVVVVAGGAKIDGDVYGDVTTFGGPAKINGRVSGSVTAFGADVELGPRARVEKDVHSLGGELREHPGAYVGGTRGGMGGSFDLDDLDDFDAFDKGRMFGSVFGWADWVQFFWALIFTGFLVILSGVVYLILQRPVERVRDAALDAPLRSLLTGFLILVLSVPALVAVMVVLAISIIGIPFLVILCLLLPFAIIAFLVATFYGYTAVALGAGGVLRSQLRLSWTSGLALLAVGIVSLRALGLSGDLLDAIGLPGFVTVLFGFGGFVVQLAAVSMAIGAVVTSRFGLASQGSPGVVPPSDLPPVPNLDGDLNVGIELGDEDEDGSDWMNGPRGDDLDRR